jgi:hypothetical protein
MLIAPSFGRSSVRTFTWSLPLRGALPFCVTDRYARLCLLACLVRPRCKQANDYQTVARSAWQGDGKGVAEHSLGAGRKDGALLVAAVNKAA